MFWFSREVLHHILYCSVKYRPKEKKKEGEGGDLTLISRLKQVQKLSANATNILLEYQGTASILSSYFSTSVIFIIGLSFTAIN